MVQGLFPDNTVLCNFAAVERLDLLRDWLRGRGRWTEAVEHEAGLSSGHLPALREVLDGGWLGEAIEVFDDDVEKIRRHAFGGPTAQPRKHLGEAQTCVLILNHAEFAGSWWLSDDTDAVEYAQRRGITTYRTIDMAALGVHRFLRAVEPGTPGASRSSWWPRWLPRCCWPGRPARIRRAWWRLAVPLLARDCWRW